MLRKIRIALAAVFWVGITLLLLDFTGTLHAWLGWMARIQFIPAVLALNLAAIAGLAVLTLLFGRVYCSVICPLGVMQDMISWTRGRTSKKARFRFRYSPAKSILRYSVLVLFIVTLVAGASQVAALIAPYSAYGRIVSSLLAPLWQWGNNLLAYFSERVGSYTFYRHEVWLKSIPVLAVAAATFIAIFVMAWRNGRAYCNTICPVGTILGTLSRFSLFVPAIDADKCRGCRLCERQCKASCINATTHEIDYSRCVDCMDCINACKDGAVRYTLHRRKSHAPEDTRKTVPDGGHADIPGTDGGRRAFLGSAMLATASLAAASAYGKVDGGLADVFQKKAPKRGTPICPAGSSGLRHLTRHCTACQLCISACPNQVLRPSSSLDTLMQPEMSYERGYCRPECTKCSEVCPSGAITRVSMEEKTAIQIGHAVLDYDLCVAKSENVHCGNCARHCPSGAISMVGGKDGATPIPVVDTERCIGCGACENLCPARPRSAIHVEGHEVHRYI